MSPTASSASATGPSPPALIGGAYSSTAVTQSLAQRLGSEQRAGAEPAGIALATAVMYLRVPLLIGDLRDAGVPAVRDHSPAGGDRRLGRRLLALPHGAQMRRAEPRPATRSPCCRRSASSPFVAFAAVAAKWAQGRFGQSGIAVLLLIVGSMDVDTAIITLGGLSAGAISPLLAAMAIAGTIIVNMAVKIGITLVYARGKGLSAALAMAASVVALAMMIGLAWTRL